MYNFIEVQPINSNSQRTVTDQPLPLASKMSRGKTSPTKTTLHITQDTTPVYSKRVLSALFFFQSKQPTFEQKQFFLLNSKQIDNKLIV